MMIAAPQLVGEIDFGKKAVILWKNNCFKNLAASGFA